MMGVHRLMREGRLLGWALRAGVASRDRPDPGRHHLTGQARWLG